jgi:hypothetical protein
LIVKEKQHHKKKAMLGHEVFSPKGRKGLASFHQLTVTEKCM